MGLCNTQSLVADAVAVKTGFPDTLMLQLSRLIQLEDNSEGKTGRLLGMK